MLNIMFDKRCQRMINVEINAGTIENPHIVRAHGECPELRLVTDEREIALHGVG